MLIISIFPCIIFGIKNFFPSFPFFLSFWNDTVYNLHTDHISSQFIAIYDEMKVELISIRSISVSKKRLCEK